MLFPSHPSQKKKKRFHSDPAKKGKSQGDYVEQIMIMKQQMRNTLFVDYADVQTFDNVLAETIAREYYRYASRLLCLSALQCCYSNTHHHQL